MAIKTESKWVKLNLWPSHHFKKKTFEYRWINRTTGHNCLTGQMPMINRYQLSIFHYVVLRRFIQMDESDVAGNWSTFLEIHNRSEYDWKIIFPAIWERREIQLKKFIPLFSEPPSTPILKIQFPGGGGGNSLSDFWYALTPPTLPINQPMNMIKFII